MPDNLRKKQRLKTSLVRTFLGMSLTKYRLKDIQKCQYWQLLHSGTSTRGAVGLEMLSSSRVREKCTKKLLKKSSFLLLRRVHSWFVTHRTESQTGPSAFSPPCHFGAFRCISVHSCPLSKSLCTSSTYTKASDIKFEPRGKNLKQAQTLFLSKA